MKAWVNKRQIRNAVRNHVDLLWRYAIDFAQERRAAFAHDDHAIR